MADSQTNSVRNPTPDLVLDNDTVSYADSLTPANLNWNSPNQGYHIHTHTNHQVIGPAPVLGDDNIETGIIVSDFEVVHLAGGRPDSLIGDVDFSNIVEDSISDRARYALEMTKQERSLLEMDTTIFQEYDIEMIKQESTLLEMDTTIFQDITISSSTHTTNLTPFEIEASLFNNILL